MYKSRVRSVDLLGTGLVGLRSRPGRTSLTALGIAIGIASMVAVLGISSSSKADLIAEIDALGTNLLAVQGGQSLFGDSTPLPIDSRVMIDGVNTVTDSAAVIKINTKVYRNRLDESPNGLAVLAIGEGLIDALDLEASSGRLIEGELASLPVAVLGSVAAKRLGLSSAVEGATVSIADQNYVAIGILAPLPLNPDIDRSVLIGDKVAIERLGIDANPTTIYLRVRPERIEVTRRLLARMANPVAPNEVQVSRPSDALEARAKVDESLQKLLLGLGGVALVVGGVGVANVMVISVLERRGEIGLRRALGAKRGHIRSQFVIEAVTLAGMGGIIGVVLGSAVTWAYATRQGWLVDIPVSGLAYGVAGALLIGALAGLYPAAKAARLDPAEAVRPRI